ncbi:hypothetical protein L1765_13120 [Microaerobacter geothermalis]|uniref:hypothetical protein n=1 Tax=Microaerobacter geothermalis TaxID=674972 RepID=UPI001F17F32F|nr:hypothetical protein [Microaerobacter geothermalis]MCF6094902.1 hypothetical protein [Microaerobacter geothermalis]
MNQFIAKIIDRVGLVVLHTKKSRESHFQKGNKILSSLNMDDYLEQIYPSPSTPDISFNLLERNHGYEIGKFS